MAVQVLKLGRIGNEITLPTESRVNEQGADTPFFNEARSASKKLHVDFITTKQNWSISWAVISEDDYKIVNDTIKQQYTNTPDMSFIYTDEDGTEIQGYYRVTVTNKGSLVQRDTYYYNGFTIQLEEY